MVNHIAFTTCLHATRYNCVLIK